MTPAAKILTSRLVLRCWKPEDAPLILDAISSSIEHLRSWMPWAAAEPLPLEQQQAKLERFAADFAAGQNQLYGIFDAAESTVLGGSGLHFRNGDGDREIGYWLRSDAIGQGYATETASALATEAFRALPIETVTIVCDPGNVRSAAVPHRLGFENLGIFEAAVISDDRQEDQIWRVTREAWARR